MKKWFDGFCAAFSMYSTVPMPQIQWEQDTMRYLFCFFPWVGALTGGLCLGWAWLCRVLSVGPMLFAGGMTLLPLAVSGGIHLDGLVDTADALYSRRETEKKLEILKDPHVGAFGVIVCGGYLLAAFALWGQLYETPRLLSLCCAGFFLSRCCSALAVVSFPAAKNSGLAHLFSGYADQKAVRICCGCDLALAGGLLIWPFGWAAVAVLAAVGIVFAGFWRLCRKQFGGITGDLAGFFLQITELAVLLVCTFGGMLG
ncbi:MAG: adenosylcobinamide-GDP ribazoletransferase [Oscillospiraceae bacterium]|nr:adenosylcobinamide-GDP ribazoletransferase [Oscillospiraceae bacterium]